MGEHMVTGYWLDLFSILLRMVRYRSFPLYPLIYWHLDLRFGLLVRPSTSHFRFDQVASDSIMSIEKNFSILNNAK